MNLLLPAICALALATLTGPARAQAPQPPEPQAYLALHDRPAREPAARHDPYAAMNGGFAGSSSARDVARTFGY